MSPSKRKKLPSIAVIGRPNVGKSTLFNRIIGKQRAIVHNREGITRDRFINEAKWDDHVFMLVDTGGIIENPVDDITRKMQEQVQQALDEARVIIFVLDGQQELTRMDRLVCESLVRTGKPVVLAVNKLDNHNLAMNRYEYYELGMGDPIAVSASHNLGIEELMECVVSHLPPPATVEEEDVSDDTDEIEEEEEKKQPIKVAIIGRPNVGKSSFINAILNEDRAIVSETPGTTRDAIDVDFKWRDNEYLLIDTAGMRRKAGIKDAVEHYSVTRSLRAVRRADVCLIMVEATEGLTEQDKRVIGYTLEQGSAFILVWTKWDLVEDKAKRFKDLADELDLRMGKIQYAPQVTISNITRKRLFTVFDYVDRIALESKKRIPTAEVNRFIEKIKAKHNPPSQKGRHAKILYAAQTSVKPTEFVLFVNQTRLFHFSYMRFIENQLRAAYGFEGVPIRLELREEKRKS
ncbi:MAG: ribosome biogenesis GTPase Der [Candidatus Hydrogenedentes bacterium]|nr:ribosome biogenesis GTPase Der [Candidatus Hydrogenedentota bacterium]